MRVLLMLLLIFGLSTDVSANTLNVPGDYPTIQGAIDAAVYGDIILVASGTYVENIDFLGKTIYVKSCDGAEATIIDGGGAATNCSVVTFDSGEDVDSILDGFTVTNGILNIGMAYGGGIYCNGTSPTIMNNIITGNKAMKEGAGIYCVNYASPEIWNNSITGNMTTSLYAVLNGGGIYCGTHSFPNIMYNLISGNITYKGSGGGIYCTESSALIVGNVIADNRSGKYGGGICSLDSWLEVFDNTLTGNVVENIQTGYSFGGGIFGAGSSLNIRDNTVAGNNGQFGGGICCESCSSEVAGNTIAGNYAEDGGGVYCDASLQNLTGNVISGNEAWHEGGGIYCPHDSSPTVAGNTITGNSADKGAGIFVFYATPRITDNMICNNVVPGEYFGCGGGVYCSRSSPVMINNTIVNNVVAGGSHGRGGGIYCSMSTLEVTNTILWGNTAPSGPAMWIGDPYYPSISDISYSDLEGGQSSVYIEPGCTLIWGDGMIDADPLFVDDAEGDFHLTFWSPCKDVGDNSSATPSIIDFEGDQRITFDTVDMGADEYHIHLYCTGTALPNSELGTHFIGFPNHVALLFIGIDVLETPVFTPHGYWHLLPPLTTLNLGPLPMSGVYSFSSRIPPDGLGLEAVYLQGLVRGRLTNLCTVERK